MTFFAPIAQGAGVAHSKFQRFTCPAANQRGSSQSLFSHSLSLIRTDYMKFINLAILLISALKLELAGPFSKVLVTFLLLGENTMTRSNLEKESSGKEAEAERVNQKWHKSLNS